MIAEERPHDMIAIGIVAARHHAGERLRIDLAAFAHRQRRKRQQRRAFKIARHQEPPRRQRRRRNRLGAAGAQIGCEQRRRLLRDALVRRSRGIEARDIGAPFRGQRRARRGQARIKRILRPALIGFAEQRQIEQPFAGIIDEVDRQLRRPPAEAGVAFEFKRQPQFGDAARRFGPRAFVGIAARPVSVAIWSS